MSKRASLTLACGVSLCLYNAYVDHVPALLIGAFAFACLLCTTLEFSGKTFAGIQVHWNSKIRETDSKEIGLVFLFPLCIFLSTFKQPSSIDDFSAISNVYALFSSLSGVLLTWTALYRYRMSDCLATEHNDNNNEVCVCNAYVTLLEQRLTGFLVVTFIFYSFFIFKLSMIQYISLIVVLILLMTLSLKVIRSSRCNLSFAESIFLGQIVVYFCLHLILRLTPIKTYWKIVDYTSEDVSVFNQVTFASSLFFMIYVMKMRSTTLTTSLGVTFVGFTLPVYYLATQSNYLMYIVHFCMKSSVTMKLISSWSALTIAVFTLAYFSNPSRKFYHLVITGVFASALFVGQLDLLRLATVCFCSLLVVVEIIRLYRLSPPLSQFISTTMNSRGQQQQQQQKSDDNNKPGDDSFIFDHFTLLLGIALPLLVHRTPVEVGAVVPLSMYSGLISVGIGDSMASIVGQSFGSTKWNGSNKTIIGSVSCFLSQLLCVYLLLHFNLAVTSLSLGVLFVIILLVSLMEAFTNQIDNLLLPMFLYVMLLESPQ